METLIKIFRKLSLVVGYKTYAQCGEDRIMEHLCRTIGISNPRYIDIGTNHPTILSNTYLFYTKGSNGVCIEPSPILAKKIARKRRRDLVRAIGVGASTSNEPLSYYVLTAQTMNTFSKEDAEQTMSVPEIYGRQKIERVEQIKIIGINDILDEYPQYTDIISIDTEGMDEEIVRAIDFARHRPKIFCIETVTQNSDNTFYKNSELINFLKDNGYVVYADTYLNTIFVDRALWKYGTTIV